MIATLIATLFAGAALLAVATMILSWRSFGFRFTELRDELRVTHDAVSVRYSWRGTGARPIATIYNLDFKAKADALPFRPAFGPELKPELLAAA